MSVRVMVVEDQGIVANDIKMRLESIGYNVVALCLCGEDAVREAGEIKPDIILMDIMLGSGIDGVETARQIRNKDNIPIIFLTAYEDDETLGRAKETGPAGYILKPYDERDLRTNIEIALNKHNMEDKLHKSEKRFRVLAQEIADAVVVMELDSCLWINKAFTTLLGYSEQEVIGEVPDMFIEHDELALFKQRAQYWLEGKEIFTHFESAFRCKNGRSITVDLSAKKIDFDDNDALLMVVRDVTSRKRLEDDLRRLKDSLQGEIEKKALELNNAQERLVYSEKLAAIGTLAMGNEFRQRMSNINSALSDLKIKAQEYSSLAAELNVLEDGMSYLDNIFGTFAILTDAVCLKSENVDIFDLLAVTVDSYIFSENITVESNLDEHLPHIDGDRDKLECVFVTLLDNAISSIDGEGIITIDAYTEGDEVVISIGDNGNGMPCEDAQRIFEPNMLLKNYKQGLGLPTASLLVEGHGGRIDIDTELDKGTCITVYLPLPSSFEPVESSL